MTDWKMEKMTFSDLNHALKFCENMVDRTEKFKHGAEIVQQWKARRAAVQVEMEMRIMKATGK